MARLQNIMDGMVFVFNTRDETPVYHRIEVGSKPKDKTTVEVTLETGCGRSPRHGSLTAFVQKVHAEQVFEACGRCFHA